MFVISVFFFFFFFFVCFFFLTDMPICNNGHVQIQKKEESTSDTEGCNGKCSVTGSILVLIGQHSLRFAFWAVRF